MANLFFKGVAIVPLYSEAQKKPSLSPLVPGVSGPLVLFSLGPLVPRSCGLGPLVPWSSGPLVLWSLGPLVLWSFGAMVLWPLCASDKEVVLTFPGYINMIRCGLLCGLLLKGRQWVMTTIQVYGGLGNCNFSDLKNVPSVCHICLFHIHIHLDIYM